MPDYIVIGGGAYQRGSAAAKLAQKLYDAMPKQVQTPAVPNAVTPPATPAMPTTFPTYPTGNTRTASSGYLTPGGGSGGATLAPGPVTTGKGAYGLVPSVPSPISTAGGAIGGNLANLPGLANLGTETTKLNANLAALPFQANLPGYTGLLGQSSQNIASNLAGVIDPATWEQLQTHVAERGARVGISPASPNFNTALMRALGETSTAEEALGQQQLNAAIARTPTGQPFNTAGQQISPADLQAAQYAANLYGAAPDPTQAAQANLDTLLKSIEAGRAAGLGGIGGGGGGGIPPARIVTAPGAGTNYPIPIGYGGGGAGNYAPRAPTAPGAPQADQGPQIDAAVQDLIAQGYTEADAWDIVQGYSPPDTSMVGYQGAPGATDQFQYDPAFLDAFYNYPIGGQDYSAATDYTTYDPMSDYLGY